MEDRSSPPRRVWRLHWHEPSTGQPGIAADADGVTTLWVGSDDAAAIKAFVAAQNWASDAIIEVTLETAADDRPPRSSVLCRPVHVAQWDPEIQPLPSSDASARRSQGRTEGRLALLQAMRRGVDDAVALGALDPSDGAGLMLLAQDALDRHERTRGSR